MDGAEEVGVFPGGLGSGGDVAVYGRGGGNVGGAEGADDEGVGLAVIGDGGFEEGDEGGDRFLGDGGGDSFPGADVIGPRGEGGDHFGASGFDGGDEGAWHGGRVNVQHRTFNIER